MTKRALRAGADAPADPHAPVTPERRVVLDEAAARAIAAGSLSVGSEIPLQAAVVLGEDACRQLEAAFAPRMPAPPAEPEPTPNQDA